MMAMTRGGPRDDASTQLSVYVHKKHKLVGTIRISGVFVFWCGLKLISVCVHCGMPFVVSMASKLIADGRTTT